MLRKLVVGPYQANCYILGCDRTRQGVVIDPGDEPLRIIKEVTKNKLSIKNILITHGHMDHVGAASEINRITRAKILIHPLDAQGINPKIRGDLAEGGEIPVGKYKLKVIHTPGHSPGGCCFYAPGAVFSGDTLFAGSVGRTDFPGGSHELLIRGVVDKIFPLGDHLRIYPGHGPFSTIGREKATNPFFRGS
jgi:glyoxylase-like metal-dependent hydrolase (beta-lactamase superfamily II)